MKFFLYSWFYLQNTGKMYMYLLGLCTCAITQNYFQTYTGLTFSCKTNNATMYKCQPLHLHYYFQTQVNTKKLILHTIISEKDFLFNTTMCYTPKHQPIWQNDKREQTEHPAAKEVFVNDCQENVGLHKAPGIHQ